MKDARHNEELIYATAHDDFINDTVNHLQTQNGGWQALDTILGKKEARGGISKLVAQDRSITDSVDQCAQTLATAFFPDLVPALTVAGGGPDISTERSKAIIEEAHQDDMIMDDHMLTEVEIDTALKEEGNLNFNPTTATNHQELTDLVLN